jgi:hypothetical protein
VPLAEFYCSIYENFHIAYINEIGEPSIEAAPACGGVEVGGIAVLPVPRSSEGWMGFERNGQGATIPDMRFGDGVLIVALKGNGYSSRCKCTRRSLMDSG